MEIHGWFSFLIFINGRRDPFCRWCQKLISSKDGLLLVSASVLHVNVLRINHGFWPIWVFYSISKAVTCFPTINNFAGMDEKSEMYQLSLAMSRSSQTFHVTVSWRASHCTKHGMKLLSNKSKDTQGYLRFYWKDVKLVFWNSYWYPDAWNQEFARHRFVSLKVSHSTKCGMKPLSNKTKDTQSYLRLYYWPCSREIMHLVMPVHQFVCLC